MNKKNIPTLVRFGTVGAGNTLVDFVVFFLLTSLHVPYLAAQLFSDSAGVANSYIWNRTWTFQVKEKAHGAEIVRFIMINLERALHLSFCTFFKKPACPFLSARCPQQSQEWPSTLPETSFGCFKNPAQIHKKDQE